MIQVVSNYTKYCAMIWTGASSVIIFIAALCILRDENLLCKYADDLNLLNPGTTPNFLGSVQNYYKNIEIL